MTDFFVYKSEGAESWEFINRDPLISYKLVAVLSDIVEETPDGQVFAVMNELDCLNDEAKNQGVVASCGELYRNPFTAGFILVPTQHVWAATHDIAATNARADQEVAALLTSKDGASLFETPLHPYTEALLSAVPIPKASARERKRLILTGDVPSPINPPSGCHFHTRCPYAHARCKAEAPLLREITPGHVAACHLHDAGPKIPLARPAAA